MKLRMMQPGGGLIYTPFIPEQYVDRSNSTKTSDGEDIKLDPLDKELLSLMKDQNLLPSDVNKIFTQLINFQKRSQRLSALGETGSYRSVMPGMLQIMQMVANAKYNKAKSDEAIKQITSKDTGADVALDKNGRMYVQTSDGKITKVSINDFDPEKYYPISNSELLYARENSLPFDTEILSDITQTVGMTDISKEIDRIINEFGTTKSEGYYDKELVDMFLALKSPNGIYKLTEEKTSADLQKAWKVIYKQLPTKMQQVLNARAKISGETPWEYIHEIVLSNIDYKQSIDFDEQQSKAAGFDTDPLKTRKDKEALIQSNYLLQIGELQGIPTRIDIYPRASKIHERGAINAQAYMFGTVIDRDYKPIDKMSVSNMLKNGWAFAAGVPGNVTFGNKLLKDYELEALLFDNQSNLAVVMLPYKNENGHIVPDFELYNKFNEYKEAIKGKTLTKMEKNTIAYNLGLDPSKYIIDEYGNIGIRDVMAFLTVSAYAGDDTIDLSKDNQKFLEKVDNKDGQHIKDLYNNMVMYGSLRPAKKGNVTIQGYAKSGKNDFWKGNVYVPIRDSYNSLLLSGIGEFVPKYKMTNYLERTLANTQYNDALKYVQQNDPNYDVNKNLGQFKDE